MVDLIKPTHRDLAAGIVRVADENPDIPKVVITTLKDRHLIAVKADGRLRLTEKGSAAFQRIEQGTELSTINFD